MRTVKITKAQDIYEDLITLDKLKIIAPIDSISITDYSYFKTEITNDEIRSYSYTQQSPFLLYVEQDIEEQEIVIEFTGKILMEDYPRLISRDTIKQCFGKIHRMGFCNIDFDRVWGEGQVCKIDVSKDVAVENCQELSEYLRTHLSNNRKYQSRIISGNLIIEKNVTTKGLKRRLTIYDKWKELQRSENKEFLSYLNNAEQVIEHFKGKTRFELNLNSMEAIRKSLNIKDTRLSEVLNSEANPICDFIDAAICEDCLSSVCNSLKERKNLAFLRDCDMDIVKVETELRNYASSSSHISQLIKPYRKLLDKINVAPHKNRKESLRKFLLEVIVIVILFPMGS